MSENANTETLQNCYKTADNILEILEGLGFTTEKKLTYPEELRDLIALSVMKNNFSNKIDIQEMVEKQSQPHRKNLSLEEADERGRQLWESD